MQPNRRTIALGAGALMLSACGPKAPAASPPTPARPAPAPDLGPDLGPLPTVTDANGLKDLLDKLVAIKAAPGMSAALAHPKEIAFIASAGVRKIDDPARIRSDDAWHIGSDTKAMTAALYARLVDQKKAKWGVSLAELFPRLTLDPVWRTITLEEMLSHRAGLEDVAIPWLIARRADHRPLPEQRLETVKEALSKPPAMKVGAYSYANLDYIILGAAIEEITGKPWEEMIEAEVFKPLGMKSAGFGPPQGDAPEGHVVTPIGHLVAVGQGPNADNPPALGPAGTVHVSLEGWSKFLRVFFDPKQAFLSADSLKHLTTPAPGPGPAYACGWGVIEDKALGRMLAHTGSNKMWFAEATILLDHGAATLVAANSGADAAQKAIESVGRALARGAAA